MDNIDDWIRIYGQFVGKDHCNLYRRGLKTMKERIEKVSSLSIKLANYLENRDDINRVMYPMLPSHPTYDISKNLLRLNPGCIWFHLSHNLSNNKILKKVRSIENKIGMIELETSYGSAYCKICPWPKTKNSDYYEHSQSTQSTQSTQNPQNNNNDKETQDNRNPGKKGVWLRLAVGYDSNFDETVEQLDTTFQFLQNKAV